MSTPYYYQDLSSTVAQALHEDIGTGDISAELIPGTKLSKAKIITREASTLCGQAWVEETFHQVRNYYQASASITWLTSDGQQLDSNQTICEISGSARVLLTAERTALNFLQTLSGTASLCHDYAQQVKHTNVQLLDTRKTLPGLRHAQKYAVKTGGCHNHRIGLYDAYLIKENHIQACGTISQAIQQARSLHPNKRVEVEVETLNELREALQATADIIMLDNFSIDDIKTAVNLSQGKAKLEVSGNVTSETLKPLAETGVDYISIGALTKNCQAIDLSMRFI